MLFTEEDQYIYDLVQEEWTKFGDGTLRLFAKMLLDYYKIQALVVKGEVEKSTLTNGDIIGYENQYYMLMDNKLKSLTHFNVREFEGVMYKCYRDYKQLIID